MGNFILGFDSSYFLLVIPAMLFAFWAQMKVKKTFSAYSKVPMDSFLTGAATARAILDSNELHSVRVEQIAGNLTDHFDPRENVVRLSSEVYSGNSVAAVGVAAHETGHALQYALGYAPMKFRAAIIPVTQFGSTLSMPLVIAGFLFKIDLLINFGIILFGVVALFQLITLPVEFNASRRAIKILSEGGYVSENEGEGVKKVLTAAALTYVAALAVSLASLLRLILLSNRRR